MVLRMLGRLELEGSRLRRPKPLLLLAYLALEGPRHRRALADLFWPGAVDARDSLSTTLRRLRGALGSLLVADVDEVATTVRHDVAAFEEAVRRGEPSDVVRAYGGAFLDGLALSVHGEIEDWIVETRERLAGLARRAYLTQARRALDGGDTAAAARLGEAALTLPHAPPFDRPGLERVAWLLRASHSPRCADVEREAAQLGLVLAREADAAPNASADRFVLPIPATTFVGRDREMAEIAAVLALPHGRLVTLHGPGGAGKSRLAVEVVRRLLRDGASFDAAVVVPLEAVASADLVGDAVAAAMALIASTELPAERQVIRAIGERPVVLVLDNMEHLLDATPFVAELVRSCPALRVLVTSRVALNLVDEHRVALDGLPVEPSGAEDGAVDLLWDRMRQTGSAPGTTDDARRVCRILDGSPLAIELAAAMTRTVPLHELGARIAFDLGVLVNRDPTASERHRSLSAALDASWQLLGARHRTALASLAVFRGGFSVRDAESVADVDRGVLADLVDASLVRVLPTGRYERHPLIGQFLGAKLAADPDIEVAVRQRHAAYYLDQVGERDHAMLGAEASAAAVWIETSLANVRAAWGWAVERGDAERLAAAAWPLVHFAEMRGRFGEVGVMFDEVAATIDARTASAEDSRALAAVLACRAFVLFRTGRYAASLEQGQLALSALRGVDERFSDTWGAWAARQGMALSLAALGRLHEGLALVRDNVAMCRTERATGVDEVRWQRALDVMEGTSHETLAVVAIQADAFEAALEHLDDAVALLASHAPYGLGYIYWSLGQAYLGIGAVDTADTHLQEGLRFAEATGFRNQVGHVLNEVARVQLRRGDLAGAERTCERVIQLAVESGDSALEASSRAAYGLAALSAGRPDDARARFRASVGVAREAACYPAAMEAFEGLARLAASEGREGEAVRLYAYLSVSPHATVALTAAARDALAALAQHLDLDTYERHHRLGATASPERAFAAV
jgi:predicted ATPase